MLNRRHLLAGAAGATALSFPAFAFGQAHATDKRLLVVILRGAMDGLAAVPPVGDPNYASLRGGLALQRADVLPLDSIFALHKSLPKLKAMYDVHELIPIHAAATGYRDRSHFDGQNVLESGAAAPFARTDGWLNAALGALPHSRADMGVALSAQAPLVLRGSTPVATWSPSVLPSVGDDTVQRLLALYDARDPQLAGVLHAAMGANAVAMDSGAGSMNGAGGGYRQIAPLAQVAARFLKDQSGPIAAVMDMGGWDTHANQGAAQGPLARNLGLLDDGIGAFKTEMGPAWWSNTAVIIVTEFGRTAAPNGAGGTDHGTAAAAFLAGGAVQGGRVLADWPGLSSGALYQNRDLKPTLDIRAAIKGVLADHMRVPNAALDSAVFPDSSSVRPVQSLLRA
jgi:uncharacterized protein (DUF1501 family)